MLLRGASGLEVKAAPPGPKEPPCGIARPVYFRRSVPGLVGAAVLFGQDVHVPRGSSAAAKRGLRYERKVLAHLTRDLEPTPHAFATGLPFSFTSALGRGSAIPDALIFDFEKRAVCVVEIKLRHSADAYFQLRDFYLPIVDLALARSFRVCGLEVCRFYDPDVKLPSPVSFVNAPALAFETRECFHPLMIWSDR